MGPLALLAFFAGMVVLTARSPRAGLLATVFFAAWSGFDVDFGLRVSAYQLTVAAVIMVTLVRSLQSGWQVNRVASGRLLAVFLVFATLTSLGHLGFLPDAEISSGVLRSPAVRAPIQIALFAFAVSPALLIAWQMGSADDLRAIFRTYMISIVVLALIGWAQLLIWYGTGSNPLPIGVVNQWLGGSAEVRYGAFDFASLAINRMNSLAGEPRQLGTALVFAMLLIQSVMLTVERPDWRRLAPLWGFFLITAVFTYSTSAVATWLIGTVVQIAAPLVLGVRIRRSLAQLAAAVLIVVAPAGLAIGVAQASGIPVLDLLADRTINRIDESGAVEDFDLAIIDYFTAHPDALPLGTGLGNVHLYAGPYLQPEFKAYAENAVFTAKVQYLRIISELGVIGFVLFLAWYAVLVIDVAWVLRRVRESALAPAIPIGVTTLAVYLANGAIAAEFWTIAGALGVAVTALRGAAPRPVVAPARFVPA